MSALTHLWLVALINNYLARKLTPSGDGDHLGGRFSVNGLAEHIMVTVAQHCIFNRLNLNLRSWSLVHLLFLMGRGKMSGKSPVIFLLQRQKSQKKVSDFFSNKTKLDCTCAHCMQEEKWAGLDASQLQNGTQPSESWLLW